MKYLRQNTATVVAVGVFPDPTTGAAVTTLATQAGRLTKAGVGSAFTAVSWTHDYGGHYLVGLATGDVDTLGRLRIAFNSTLYLPVWEDFTVLSPAVYDWLIGSSGVVPANFVQLNGVAVGTSDGLAQAGGTSTITLATTASASNNVYVDSTITLVAGTGAGQSRVITGYVGSTRVATVQRAWDVTPDATTAYAIDPTAAVAGLLTLDGGIVLAGSSATSIAASGADLNMTAGAYVSTVAPQFLRFTSGVNKGERRQIQTYTLPAGVPTFGFASPGFAAAPGAGDPFVIG